MPDVIVPPAPVSAEPPSSPVGSFLASPTFRRILYALAGLLLPILNQKLGWNLPTEQVVASIAGLVSLIASSTFNQAHERGTDAAVAIAEVKAAGPSSP